jgi:hypothetical protein
MKMSKTKVTNEQASHEPKKHGCCGGGHVKDQQAQPAQKENAILPSDDKHQHAHHSDGGSGCCGGGKASK